MDGMDMSGDGMTGLGSDINHRFARAYWYITATVVGSLMVVRGINHVGAVKRYSLSSSISHHIISRPPPSYTDISISPSIYSQLIHLSPDSRLPAIRQPPIQLAPMAPSANPGPRQPP